MELRRLLALLSPLIEARLVGALASEWMEALTEAGAGLAPTTTAGGSCDNGDEDAGGCSSDAVSHTPGAGQQPGSLSKVRKDNRNIRPGPPSFAC